MQYSTATFASVVVVGVGALIFWANPRRNVNQSVFAVSLAVTAWLAFSQFAVSSESASGLVWLKWAYAAGGVVPLTLWLVKESILTTFLLEGAWFRRNFLWFLGAAAMATVPFMEVFIPSYSTDTNRVHGWGYYLYYAGLLFSYGWILQDALRNLKAVTGVRRLELQIWLCGGCVVAVAIYALLGLGAITQQPSFRLMGPLAVLIFYAGTGYAITTHRIFDARQIVLVGVEKTTLVLLVAASAYVLKGALDVFLSEPFSLIGTTALALWIAVILKGWLDRTFQFLPQGVAARQAAFAAAQRETRVENLETSFGALLEGWGQTEHAVILSGTQGQLRGGGIELVEGSVVIQAMRQLRWATPERLARERSTPARVAVSDFLVRHRLGVLVIEEGPALTVVVGVAVGASRRPYTYPQVTQLMELASIMQAALERAHFSAKAQHTEQLATVGLLGASLAHEIRNPLVSIKTFVQLLPTHHQDPKFRDKFFKLIGDEVGRIDQLTEQLLDLASPRAYEAKLIELHPLLRSSLDLVSAKAAHRNVEFRTEFAASPDAAFTDASAAKQVMLNLCFNAIQAVEDFRGEQRWVKIATRNTAGGIEMAVADSGPGISEEMRPKLFLPFQTSKSTGFGLGLAICSDILANLHASISVDPPVPGQGATFRVTFPCQPLSS